MKKYMALFLVVILIILSACSGKPTSENSEPISENITPSNNPKKEEVNVHVDLMLEEGEEVIIEKVNPDAVDDEVEIFAYDIKLSSGQPEGAIEIIIPYSDEGLTEEEELLSICGKHLNEKTNKWEDIFYTVDTVANEVHIITDHLSSYGVFKITNPQKRTAYISEVNSYAAYMTNAKAQAVLETYSKQGASWQSDTVAAFLETTGSVEYFAATNIHTLLTLGEAYDNLISKPFQNAMTGLSISTACTQLVYDAYNNGVRSTEAATTAMKSALSIGINFATAPIKLAYVGVSLIDIALTDVQSYAVVQKYKSTKNMYDAYYKRPNVRRNIGDWRKLFEEAYKDNKEDPQAALDKMKSEIDSYVNKYWVVAEADWSSWIDAYDKNANLSKYPWPYKKDRDNISAIHKANLYDDLNALFNQMVRNMYLDSLIEREKEFNKLASILNQQFSVVIREDMESEEGSTWAGCYAKLAPLSLNAESSSWTGKLNEEGGGRITFTLLAHQRAGFPMTLELYRTADDVKVGNKLRTIQLKPFIENEQTIILQPQEELEPDETEPPESEPPESKPPISDPPVSNPPVSEPPVSQPPVSEQPIVKEPVKEKNPWYEVTIISSDNEMPDAFAGWFAVLSYPQDSAPELKSMYQPFDSSGVCMLFFQKSDYRGLESPSQIWLYKDVSDLLSKRKPDKTASFSPGGSYVRDYQGEPVYSKIVRVSPPANKTNYLESITGDYKSYMIRSETFIPGEGMMEIDKKETFELYEQPSADVWLHYNGPSLTLKSAADPYNTEHVLRKYSDTYYELEVEKGSKTIKHSIRIHSAGKSAQYTYLDESENGTRYFQEYMLEKK